MTGRQVALGDLTEREKDTALLVISSALRDLLEQIEGVHSHELHRRLEVWREAHAAQLGFLERAYQRTAAAGPTQIEISRNDRVWEAHR